ncbi:TOMM precursor leader peptide-binding protein [Streptomyces sp. ST2-7A]|uniref:TOMM precursor leader peptide-binding protein n=1 Tax=Streptomyces sp. ST2-7A TaxID=2907214 RepID=UPI001F3E8B20|nr:TOMM precursor leader peptide-binding protein [Streptomyces sp. ST2-7A]MCE7080563.1 TOMM precursor leader peptide-binding protein [Streptomyces sp. ST2-7A]
MTAVREAGLFVAPALADAFPGIPERWEEVLRPLLGAVSGTVSLGTGWDARWEGDMLRAAAGAGREHLSVRLHDDEVFIGPRWVPGTDGGCAGCAEVRARTAIPHPLVDDLARPVSRVVPRRPLLSEMVTALLRGVDPATLDPGGLYALGSRGSRRHRVTRNFACPLCSSVPGEAHPDSPPAAPELPRLPAHPEDPGRRAEGTPLLDRETLRERVVDPRFGPVLAVQRELTAPFAMSQAVLPDSIAMGYGRARTFAAAEPIAVLETYERMAGFPHQQPVLTDLSYREVAEVAVDPATFGEYTEEQLAHPACLAGRMTPDTPMDWVWGHDADTGRALLVPAEIGFFQYDYRYRRARHAARRAGAPPRRHLFHESSSGSALGSGPEEAALHSLLELAERDAFLLGWHRARPLPEITLSSVTDPVSRRLVDLIVSHGFTVHLLRATRDIDVPVVWALAVNEVNAYPATFASAGSGLHPHVAVRGALWELGQIVSDRMDWNRARAEEMLADPWLVTDMEDHIRLHTLPEKLERVTAVLGGPRMTLEEAFPEWPQRVRRASGGHVRGALDHIRELYAAAGLDRVVLVDLTTRDHADLGLAAVKAAVPGIIPMCFGHTQQRLVNLPRLTAALAGTPQEHGTAPYDPHPFP